MKTGNLVKHVWPEAFDASRDQAGVVLEIDRWVDKKAPCKNAGVEVKILWPDGRIESFDDTEISLVEVIT
jgi:hypothetical protein